MLAKPSRPRIPLLPEVAVAAESLLKFARSDRACLQLSGIVTLWLTSRSFRSGTALPTAEIANAPHVDGQPDTPQAKAAVVLFGWLGARPRYLQKYSQLWQHHGYPVMSVRASPASMLLPFWARAKAASTMRQIEAFRVQHRQQQMIYHCFSDAGFIYMTKVLQAGEREIAARQGGQGRPTTSITIGGEQRLSGIIFDSAPAVLNAVIATRGLISSTQNEPVLGLQARHPRLYWVVLQLAELLLSLPYMQRHIRQIWDYWDVEAPICQQLYLYSDEDAIIDHISVEDFARTQAERGVKIEMHRWKGSGHCEHFRMYPQEYQEQLAAFSEAITSQSHQTGVGQSLN